MSNSFFDFMPFNNPTLMGVYIVFFTVITSAIINLLTARINNYFQKEREQISQIQDIYAGCIKNLATVSTLSGATKDNLDNIEQSLIEAKKYLSLLLIRTKNKCQIHEMEEAAELFATGDYEKLLQIASQNGFKSSKYNYLLNEPQKQVLSAADIMLQIMIKNAHKDKRLLL